MAHNRLKRESHSHSCHVAGIAKAGIGELQLREAPSPFIQPDQQYASTAGLTSLKATQITQLNLFRHQEGRS